MPPTVTVFPPISTCTAASFSTVSVVIMAFAASLPAPPDFRQAPGPSASRLRPASQWEAAFAITPVEATRTLSSGTWRTSAAAFAVSRQYPYPSSPVQALAMPLLHTINLRRGMVVYDLLIPFHREPAFTTLVVKVPRRFAGILRIYHSHIGSSLIFDPRRCGSGRNPFAAVTPPLIISMVYSSFLFFLFISVTPDGRFLSIREKPAVSSAH